jgi:hypothetical protein
MMYVAISRIRLVFVIVISCIYALSTWASLAVPALPFTNVFHGNPGFFGRQGIPVLQNFN